MSLKPTMHGPQKSDGLVVPTKSPNNAGRAATEAMVIGPLIHVRCTEAMSPPRIRIGWLVVHHPDCELSPDVNGIVRRRARNCGG
jgi:hypothetical protein